MKHLLQKTVIAAALLGAAHASAGGLWITEYNQPTQGRAGAGEEAGNGDASDSFFNPSAMSRHTESQLMVAGGLILPQTEFDVEQGSLLNGTEDGGDAGSLTPSISAFYSHPLSEKWTAGIATVALTGSTLDYNDDWVGRFQAQDVSLLVVGAVPSVAYKLTDRLSVGFALPVMYSDLELDIAVPNIVSPGEGEGQAKLEGDDVQVAASASFHYQFSPYTAMGGRITDEFDFDYDSDIDTRYIGQVGANTELTMATIARLGIRHDFRNRWVGYATLGWEKWSQMDDVLLSTNSRGAVLPRDWHDTYHSALGFDYHMDEQWTLRSGIAYDTSPTDSSDRTADMPLDEQFRYAIGADHQRNSGLKISGTLVYADYGDAGISNSGDRNVIGFSGDYKTNQIWFTSLSFNWPLGGGVRQ